MSPKTHVRFKYTNVPTFVTASSVYVFKEVYQRTNFSQITYKASSVMEGERMHMFWGGWLDWNSGIYRRIMGKTSNILFSETARLTAYRFMSWIICYFCLVFDMLSCAYVYWCLVVTCWERADLLSLFSDVLLWSCDFPIGILGQAWCLIVSTPDLCPFSYFVVTYINPAIHAPGVYMLAMES